MVVAATQGAGCFGAAYEFLFNTSYQLRKAGLHKQVKLTYVTAEPFLGHFGIGGLPHGEQLLGMFLKKEGIEARISVAIDHVDPGALVLAGGETLPFAFGMVIPPFLGQEFLKPPTAWSTRRDTSRCATPTRARSTTTSMRSAWPPRSTCPGRPRRPSGIPKTGFPTEQMAHIAASNIAAQIRGETPTAEKAFGDIKAVCVMDAGNNGVIILADKMLPPRKHGVLIPGPQAHLMKLGFEKYFMWKMKHGYIQLP